MKLKRVLIQVSQPFLFLRKTSGNFRYELMTLIEDEKFNTNDLGFLESNNEIYNSIELSYYQFNPTKNLINSNTEIEISTKVYLNHINSQNLNLKLNPI